MSKHWMTRAQFAQHVLYQNGGLEEVQRMITNGWVVQRCTGKCVYPNCKGWYFLPLPQKPKTRT